MSSKLAEMERSQLEGEMYKVMLEFEENKNRSFLSKIKPFKDKELHAEFDYEKLKDLAADLFDKKSNAGKHLRERLKDPNKGAQD